MVILFLDLDGVLHADSVYKLPKKPLELRAAGALMMYAPVLEAILEEHDPHRRVRIVLSTSWVRFLGFSQTVKKLTPGLRRRVAGATWHSAMKKSDGSPYSRAADPFDRIPRWQQIGWYVNRHAVQHWLAIDDLHSGMQIWPDDLRDHLVLTDGTRGLGCPIVQAEFKAKLKVLLSDLHGFDCTPRHCLGLGVKIIKDVNEAELTVCAGCLELFSVQKRYTGLTHTFEPMCDTCFSKYLRLL